MKFTILYLLSFFLFFHVIHTMELKTEVKKDSQGHYQAYISVIHSPQEDLKKASFLLDGKKIEPKKENDTPQNDQVVTLYTLELPLRQEGLYIFPVLTMILDEKKFQSLPLSYQVIFSPKTEPLRIEWGIDQDQPLYPGERFQAIMKIYYVGKVEMTEENLPLLNLEGFEKKGSIILHDGRKGEYSYQEIIQRYEAKTPGTTVIKRSEIAGNIQLSDGTIVQGKAFLEPATITVAAFPEEGKPVSFDGMLGPVSIDVGLSSAETVNEGDTLKLSIKMEESAQVSTIHLPQLLCQPGFSGFFRLSDSPPSVIAGDNSKSFIFELYPLSASLSKIPSLEFSFFDLTTKTYKAFISKEIPITVHAVNLPPISPKPLPVGIDWKKVFKNPPRLQIEMTLPLGQSLLQGFKLYREGEEATVITEKERLFNEALDFFEKKKSDLKKSSELALAYYDLGNTFFQLEQPAMAIYYYYLAEETGKSPKELEKNMSEALKLLGVRKGKIISGDNDCLVIFSAVLLILSVPLFLLSRRGSYFFWTGIFFCFSGLVVGGAAWLLFYFTPLQGVLIEPATIRTGPGEQYPYLDLEPLLAGYLIDAYDLSADGKWVKVEDDQKRMGFIELSKIRFITQLKYTERDSKIGFGAARKFPRINDHK